MATSKQNANAGTQTGQWRERDGTDRGIDPREKPNRSTADEVLFFDWSFKKWLIFGWVFVKRQKVMKIKRTLIRKEKTPALQIAMGYTLLLRTLNAYHHFQVSSYDFYTSTSSNYGFQFWVLTIVDFKRCYRFGIQPFAAFVWSSTQPSYWSVNNCCMFLVTLAPYTFDG